ncbi:MAG: MFS transporter [Candidatus Kariarchaeaceae archaeon]
MKEQTNQNKPWLTKNILIYYLLNVEVIGIIVPVIYLIWSDAGLSFTQMLMTQGAFALTILILEIPSGAIADTLGRKKTLFCAYLFFTIAISVYIIASTFKQFVLAEVIFGIGRALLTGTASSIVYESLLEENQENRFSGIISKGMSIMFISSASFMMLGGFIGSISIRLPVYVAMVVLVLKTVMILLIREPVSEKAETPNQAIKSAIRTIKENYLLKGIIFVYLGSMAPMAIAFWSYQPVFLDSGYSPKMLGILLASCNLTAAVGSKLMPKIEKRFTPFMVISVLFLIDIFTLSLMVIVRNPIIIVIVLTHQLGRGIKNPFAHLIVNNQVKSNERATVISILSSCGSLAYVVSTYLLNLFNCSIEQALANMVILDTIFFTLFIVLVGKQFRTAAHPLEQNLIPSLTG